MIFPVTSLSKDLLGGAALPGVGKQSWPCDMASLHSIVTHMVPHFKNVGIKSEPHADLTQNRLAIQKLQESGAESVDVRSVAWLSTTG